MDLQTLIPTSDTITVEIKHPVTEETMVNPDKSPMTITLWNTFSDKYKEVMYSQADLRLAKALSEGEDIKPKAADMDANALDLLAKITKEWNITLGGETPKLTVKQAKELYIKVYGLRTQLEKGLNNSEAFT